MAAPNHRSGPLQPSAPPSRTSTHLPGRLLAVALAGTLGACDGVPPEDAWEGDGVDAGSGRLADGGSRSDSGSLPDGGARPDGGTRTDAGPDGRPRADAGPNTVTLTVRIEGAGAVTLEPPGGTYPRGTQVRITAVPEPGQSFSSWSDDLSGSTNPATLTMDADKAITAAFAASTPNGKDPPVVSSLFPTTILAGARAQAVLVNGSHFTPQTKVEVDDQPRATTFIGATQLTAALTDADLATATSHAVVVVGPDGTRSGKMTLGVVTTLSTTPAPTLTVDLSQLYRDVTRVASGSLYGLVEDGANTSTGLFPTPSALLDPLRPIMFRQPAPNHHHLPNGERVVVSDALKVASKAAQAGATITILMPEMYVDFPYVWSGWDDWNRMTDTIADATLRSGAKNIYGYEPWNEPNWTWDTGTWGSFNDFWKGTAQRLRARDTSAKLIGPSIDKWDRAWMRNFLTFARDNGVLPTTVVWHELGLPEGNVSEDPRPWFIADHVADYRALEKSLGIGPLPISINEFAVQREEGVPGGNIRYFAQFERTGVESACAAFWFRPGRLSNILTDQAKANGGWWLYKWYGDMTGKMAMATSSRPRALSLEGIASVDAPAKTAHVLFGGTDGEATVSLLGLGAAGFTSSQVHVKAEATPYLGADTEVAEPLLLFEGDFSIAGDRLVLPFRGLDASWGYHLVLTGSGARRTRSEAEGAALTSAAVVRNSAASSDALVGPMSAADSAATFTVQAPRAGTYRLEVRYANGSSGAATQRLSVNGASGVEVDFPSTSGWLEQGKAGVVEVAVTLQAGANTLTLSRGSGASGVELDFVQLSPVGAFRRRVEAETARLQGGPRVYGSSYASGGRYVGYIDDGAAIELSVEGVPSAGTYTLELGFFNGGGTASQTLTINQGGPVTLSFPGTGGWGGAVPNFGTRQLKTVSVTLRQGSNTLRFAAVAGGSAELDFVEVR